MIGTVKYDDIDRLKALKILPFRNVANEVSSHIFCRRFRMSFSTNSRTDSIVMCDLFLFFLYLFFSTQLRENISCITRQCCGAI